MSNRMTQAVVRRPSVPLTAKDEAELALLRTSPTFRKALEHLAPTGPSAVEAVSEAVLLHSVLEAGLAAIRAMAEADGYAEIAVQYAGQAEQRRRMSRRRTPTWIDEP
ncbi:MAG: hypothetical protein F2840_18045 [Actinobacteria bacterium]|jgi:hypothetical protein|nr:hypothetical protein [Actinomycetota bacterium]